MKKMFPLSPVLIIAFVLCWQTLTWADPARVFRVSDGKMISYEQMIDDLKKTNLVLVGEVHDNKWHHGLQLDIVKSLHTSSRPVAVGFEMFTAESQKDLDQWTSGDLPQDIFTKIYHSNWGFPWPLYADILLYVKDKKIPAIGLNLPPQITRKVASYGFSSLTKEERAKLPPETGCAVDERYMKFIRRAYSMHGHGDKQFLFFCEAQLMWDQVMARNLLEFLKKNPQRQIVVLTGNGHAWKRGIPEQIKALSDKTSYRVILPDVPGYIDPPNITVEDADYILLR